jgi:hypothetical protein
VSEPLLKPSRPLSARPWPRVRASAGFLLAWAVLNVMFNLRWPAAEPGPVLWCLLPSLDVITLLAGFALLGARGWRVPRAAMMGLTAALVIVRLFRFGDGLVRDGWRRPINLSLDLPLLPDLARLLRSTVAPVPLALGTLGAVAVLSASAWLVYQALNRIQHHLFVHNVGEAGGPRRAKAAGQGTIWAVWPTWLEPAAIALLAMVLSPLWPGGVASDRVGLFGASVLPRLFEQARFVVDARVLRESKAREIADVQLQLSRTPSGLEKLSGADVLLFFIESYGNTVYTNPQHAQKIAPVHAGFAARLERLGMTVATGQLAAPVQGGGSWMAHATFAAGVRIGDGLEFAVLRQTQPPPATMASFFRAAGYRTVLVQPGTTRPWPEGEVTGFQRRYYAPDLGYEGPAFEWAPMPDQYVIDFIAQRELAAAARAPIFAEFALISSHAPWSVQPPVVDWARLQGGRIFNQVAPVRFAVSWQTLAQAGEAYMASIGYDFEILGQFLERSVARRAGPDALIVILGDHQPHAAVTGAPPAPEIPVHVISRNRALVDAFMARDAQGGASTFVRGMRPEVGARAPAMETFLADMLRRLSRPGPLSVAAQAPSGTAPPVAAP